MSYSTLYRYETIVRNITLINNSTTTRDSNLLLFLHPYKFEPEKDRAVSE